MVARAEDRFRSANEIIDAVRQHRTALDAASRAFADELMDAGARFVEPPDLSALAEQLVLGLESARDAMIEADRVHALELADDDGPRARRDEAARLLRDALVEPREIAIGLFGSGALEMQQPPPDPSRLCDYAEAIEHLLRTAKLPPSRIAGASLDAAAWLTRLAALRNVFDVAQAVVAREAREAVTTLAEKQWSIAAYDACFARTVGLLESLLRFAGVDLREQSRHEL